MVLEFCSKRMELTFCEKGFFLIKEFTHLTGKFWGITDVRMIWRVFWNDLNADNPVL